MLKYLYIVAYKILYVYWFIFRPKTHGVKCVVENQGKILLIQNTYTDKQFWSFPGGGINKNELPEDAVKREVLEETGLVISDIVKIGTYLSRKHYKKDFVHCFKGQASTWELKLDLNEIEKAEWFDLYFLPENITQSTKEILEFYKQITQLNENLSK